MTITYRYEEISSDGSSKNGVEMYSKPTFSKIRVIFLLIMTVSAIHYMSANALLRKVDHRSIATHSSYPDQDDAESTYIDHEGICLNALPYAKIWTKNETELHHYREINYVRAGGRGALTYGEVDPPELYTLLPGSSFATWNCQNRNDCDLKIDDYSNLKVSAWTPDGEDAFVIDESTSMWVPHIKYEWLTLKRTTLKGDAAAVMGWWPNNYGHTLHDNFPLVAWIKYTLPEHTTFLLPDTKMYRKLIGFIDPQFIHRIYFYQYNEVIRIDEGTLTVAKTKSGHITAVYGNTLFRSLRHWIFDNHPEMSHRVREKYIVFYSRGGRMTHNGRQLEWRHQEDVLAMINANMKKYKRREKLIIFTGQDEEGNILAINKQFDIFRRASVMIGPHGSGLANMIWANPFPKSCNDRAQVLEFIAGNEARSVQYPTNFNGYFWVFRGMPLDFHQVLYAPNSTKKATFLQLDDLQEALDRMWR